mmetsp:Transcript_25018/g.30195  ORF Transcript_25018/g.30195 Transcript_25018/m.30195 type:complete len:452 (-) Transcript_25018:359-1714(-)
MPFPSPTTMGKEASETRTQNLRDIVSGEYDNSNVARSNHGLPSGVCDADDDSTIHNTILDTGMTLRELTAEVTNNPYLWIMLRKDLQNSQIVTDVGVFVILNKFIIENKDDIMEEARKREEKEKKERVRNGTWNRFKRCSVDMIATFRSSIPDPESGELTNSSSQRKARRNTMLEARSSTQSRNTIPKSLKDNYFAGQSQSKCDNRRSTMDTIGSYFGAKHEGAVVTRQSSLQLEDFTPHKRNELSMPEEEITEEERRRMHEEMKNPSPQVSQNSLYYISGDDSDKDCSLMERISQTSFGKLTSKISAMLAEEELHAEEAQPAVESSNATDIVEHPLTHWTSCEKYSQNETLPDVPTKPLSMQERRQQVFADAHKKNTKKWRKVPSMQALKKKMTTKGAKLKSDRRFSLSRSSRCSESSSSVSSSAASVRKPSRRHSFTFCQGSASITTAA